MLGRNPDEQRYQDGGQHPRINEQQARRFLEEILLHQLGGDHHGQGEDHHAAQQGGQRAALPEILGLEPLDFLAEAPDAQVAQQGGQQDVEDDEGDEPQDHRSAPFTLAQGKGIGAVVTDAVFAAGVLDGLPDVAAQRSDHLEVIVLAVDENAFADEPVAVPGVVVAFFQTAAHSLVVVAVHDDTVAGGRVHLQQVQRVGQTGVAVFAALLVEVEGFIVFLLVCEQTYQGVGCRLHVVVVGVVMLGAIHVRVAVHMADALVFGRSDDVETILVVMHAFPHQDRIHHGRETVGNQVDLVEDGREAAQRFSQMFIALDLQVEAAHDLVEGHPLFRIVLILPGHLFQGISHVEGVVLILGIEDQGQLVALLGHFDQALVLQLVALSQTGLHALHLGVLLVEFRAEDAERLGEVALVEDGIGGKREHQDERKGYEDFLFHGFAGFASCKDTKSKDYS